MRRLPSPSLLLAALLLAGCGSVPEPDRSGPLFFEVEFVTPPDGLDPASPAAFGPEGVDYRLSVTAIGPDREPMDWSGDLVVHASPGKLQSAPTISVVSGQAEATIVVSLAFDRLRIWLSDEGSEDSPGSFASGVAPTVYVELPTVAELQQADGSDDASLLTHQYVPLRAYDDPRDPRELLVTSVTNDGFYVTDFSDPPGSYNSLFIFTFSRPDGITVGSRLGSLAGIVAEYIGYTEMQFPTWRVESSGHSVGEPAELDPSIVCDDALMEAWEASVVRVLDVTSDFQQGAECANYLEYGQWPAVIAGSCGGGPSRLTVVNANTVPSFDFPECENNVLPEERQLEWLVGVLRHTAPADPPWIIDVRNCLDMPEANRPDDCPGLLARPPSGPRITSEFLYRDIETCEGFPYSLQ